MTGCLVFNSSAFPRGCGKLAGTPASCPVTMGHCDGDDIAWDLNRTTGQLISEYYLASGGRAGAGGWTGASGVGAARCWSSGGCPFILFCPSSPPFGSVSSAKSAAVHAPLPSLRSPLRGPRLFADWRAWHWTVDTLTALGSGCFFFQAFAGQSFALGGGVISTHAGAACLNNGTAVDSTIGLVLCSVAQARGWAPFQL